MFDRDLWNIIDTELNIIYVRITNQVTNEFSNTTSWNYNRFTTKVYRILLPHRQDIKYSWLRSINVALLTKLHSSYQNEGSTCKWV